MKYNIRKVLNIIDMAKNKNISLLCFLADARKAFDRL